MKNSIIGLALFASVMAVSASDPTGSDAKKARITRTDTELTTITATVQSINPEKREVTLKGTAGNETTFIVDSRVKRLNEVKVGDVVKADYYISLVAELRKPTAEEIKNPLTVSEDSARAPSTQTPGAAESRRVKVVTTIEGIDRSAKTITIKGPRGNSLTARVEHPENLDKMQIGENIVITYTEAMAISLEKVNKKKAE
jgi:hypothetical protein